MQFRSGAGRQFSVSSFVAASQVLQWLPSSYRSAGRLKGVCLRRCFCSLCIQPSCALSRACPGSCCLGFCLDWRCGDSAALLVAADLTEGVEAMSLDPEWF